MPPRRFEDTGPNEKIQSTAQAGGISMASVHTAPPVPPWMDLANAGKHVVIDLEGRRTYSDDVLRPSTPLPLRELPERTIGGSRLAQGRHRSHGLSGELSSGRMLRAAVPMKRWRWHRDLRLPSASGDRAHPGTTTPDSLECAVVESTGHGQRPGSTGPAEVDRERPMMPACKAPNLGEFRVS